MAQHKRGAQQVRIIGGKWKGRKLRFNGDATLRPTPGRVRETLFNWLRPEIADMRCLDAFAGSGILGFEALSQGAGAAVFVEQNPRTLQSLQKAVQELQAGSQASVVKADALRYLREATQPFDLVFLDPPFSNQALLENALHQLHAANLVRRYVYAEGPALARLEELAAHTRMVVEKHTRAGDSHAVLLSPA
jgi:16S rRNA (guanine966-N2)-methyltransferase